MGVNYGSEKVRFPSPVPVGAKLRCGATVDAVDDIPGGVQVTLTHLRGRGAEAQLRRPGGLPLLRVTGRSRAASEVTRRDLAVGHGERAVWATAGSPPTLSLRTGRSEVDGQLRRPPWPSAPPARCRRSLDQPASAAPLPGVAAFDGDMTSPPCEQDEAGRRRPWQRSTQDGRPDPGASSGRSTTSTASSTTESARPTVPPPAELPSPAELAGEDAPPPFPFWLNFDARPLGGTTVATRRPARAALRPRLVEVQGVARWGPTPWLTGARLGAARRPPELALGAPAPCLAESPRSSPRRSTSRSPCTASSPTRSRCCCRGHLARRRRRDDRLHVPAVDRRRWARGQRWRPDPVPSGEPAYLKFGHDLLAEQAASRCPGSRCTTARTRCSRDRVGLDLLGHLFGRADQVAAATTRPARPRTTGTGCP